MEMMKIIGVAFVTAITSVILKPNKPELSFAVTVTGIIVVLTFLIDGMQTTIAAFAAIAEVTGVENGLLKILLKIIGVGYLTEFAAGVLTDFGNQSIADKVALGGKITIITLAIPVFESVLSLVKTFLQLL